MISRRNHEGYSAPTAYAALSKVIRENRFTYLCSPKRDNPRGNVMRARQYCKFAVSKGRIPLAPHLFFPQFMSESMERDKALEMNFELLRLCSECWVFGDKITEGMAMEICRAAKVRYFTTKCEDILDAYIDCAGNIYTLHPGKYEYKTNIGYYLKNYDIRKYNGEINFTGTHYPNTNLIGNIDIIPWSVLEYRECYECEIPGDGTPSEENTPVEVRFNRVTVTQINLRDASPSIDDLECDAFRYAEEKEYLMAQDVYRE